MEMHLSAALETTPDNSGPAAWRPKAWRLQVPIGHSKFYQEIKAGRIETVKCGTVTLVTTPPQQYIASLRDQAA
jgi:hypothetical protein